MCEHTATKIYLIAVFFTASIYLCHIFFIIQIVLANFAPLILFIRTKTERRRNEDGKRKRSEQRSRNVEQGNKMKKK